MGIRRARGRFDWAEPLVDGAGRPYLSLPMIDEAWRAASDSRRVRSLALRQNSATLYV